MSKLNQCRVVLVPIGKPARVEVVSHRSSLKFLQRAVGGYIEQLDLDWALGPNQDRAIALIVDEEGNIKPDPRPNLTTESGQVIVGSAVVVAYEDGMMVSLSEAEAAEWLAWVNRNRVAGADAGRG